MDSAPLPLSAFLSTSCFRCFSPSPSSPSSPPSSTQHTALKRCSGCKRVRYCSPQCANEDWTDHRPLCKSLKAVRSTLSPFTPLSSGASAREIQRRRDAQWTRWAEEDELVQVGLKRGATPTEGQLLWRERRCGVCWAREGVEGGGGSQGEGQGEGGKDKGGWRACEGVCGGMAGWCCTEHEAVGRERHLSKVEGQGAWEGRNECEIIALAESIDRYHLAEHLSTSSALAPTKDKSAAGPPPKPPQPVYIPPRLLSSPSPLPKTWKDYLSALPPFPPSFQPTEAQLYGSLLPPLAPALTILSSLRRLFPSSADEATSLTLLLLDSTPETSKRETLALEELFHQLPALVRLRTVTVAPQDAAVTAPLLDKGGQPIPGQKEVKVAQLPLCRACQARGRERTIEHVKSLDDPDFRLEPTLVDEQEQGGGKHLTLALAWNTSLALCTPPTLSSSSSDETPTDKFWSSSVLQPLASFSPALGNDIALVIAAQTKDDLSTSLSFAHSVLFPSTSSPPTSSFPSSPGWTAEKNPYRDPRPRVEGWWDHRSEGMCVEGEGEERDEDGGVSWAGGWVAGWRIGGDGGGGGGEGERKGGEKVGR
ncbi:hypothetical protein JCM11251_004481 [Rhodosporidiobolus azoricus]